MISLGNFMKHLNKNYTPIKMLKKKLNDLKQHKFYYLTVTEVKISRLGLMMLNQVVCRAALLLEALEENLFLAFSGF